MAQAGDKKTSGWQGGVMTVFILTLSYRVLGFFRESATAAFLGNSAESDAYYVAYSIPYMIISVIAWGSMAAAAVPVMAPYAARRDHKALYSLVNRAASLMLLVLLAVCGLMLSFAGPLTDLFAPGFDTQTRILTVSMARRMIPMVVPLGLSGLFSSALMAVKKFGATPASNLVFNGFLLTGSIVAATFLDIGILTASVVAAAVAQFGYCWFALRGTGYRYRLEFGVDKELRQLFTLMLPVCLSTLLTMANQAVGRAVASGLDSGSIASLHYAEKVYYLPLGILVGAVTSVTLAYLSQYASEGNYGAVRDLMKKSLSALMAMIVPVVAALWFFSVPVVSILFERGAFTPEDTLRTAASLRFYSLALPGATVMDLYNRVYYAMKKPKLPLIITLCAAVFNGFAAWALSGRYRETGVALAFALATSAGAVFSHMIAVRRYPQLKLKFDAGLLLRYAAAVFASGLGLWAMLPLYMQFFSGAGFLVKLASFGGVMAVFLSVYLLLLQVLRIVSVPGLVKDITRRDSRADEGKT